MKDFKTFVNENILVPRNIKGRKDKLKQLNIRLLSQEVIDGDLEIDESFMDIDPKFVKLKKVNGNVRLSGREWTEIPAWLKDVEITKNFGCSYNKLSTLINYPQVIGGSFYCGHNQLISLEGCPKTIQGHFVCSHNQLKSLEGGPKNIILDFSCSNNQLTSLEGCPENVGGIFWCYENKVKLELPKNVNLKSNFVNS